MQAVIGILITLFYIALVSYVCPYDTTSGLTNNQLAIADHCSLLVLLLQVVMIKYHVAIEAVNTPAYEPGYDAQLINTVMVLTLVSTGLLGGVLMLNDLRRAGNTGAVSATPEDEDTPYSQSAKDVALSKQQKKKMVV